MNAGGECNGTWTRVLGEEKSILYYFLINKSDVECYEKLEIDKDIIWVSCKINRIEKQTSVIYSDNQLMQAKFKFDFQNKGEIKLYTNYINNNKKFFKETQDTESLKIWQSNKSFQTNYTEWN